MRAHRAHPSMNQIPACNLAVQCTTHSIHWLQITRWYCSQMGQSKTEGSHLLYITVVGSKGILKILIYSSKRFPHILPSIKYRLFPFLPVGHVEQFITASIVLAGELHFWWPQNSLEHNQPATVRDHNFANYSHHFPYNSLISASFVKLSYIILYFWQLGVFQFGEI